jgi:hypothetical protein
MASPDQVALCGNLTTGFGGGQMNLNPWRLGGCSLIAGAVAFATPITAQTITDGDTLKQGGVTYRL